MAALRLYGKRDAYNKASRSLITRPDDTMFIQNAVHTYRQVDVPMVQPPEGRSRKLGAVPRRQGKEGTMSNTMIQAQADALGAVIHECEVRRELSETGRSWLITLRRADGTEATVSRLRSSREGNGF